MPLPRRRHIRLDPVLYGHLGTRCSATLSVADRVPIFANPAIGRAAVDVLEAHAAKAGTPIYAYCFMPDHVHLVLGPSQICDIVTFVGRFKNLVQRAAWQLGIA